MAYLIKNIKKLVQVETKPVLLRAGKDMQTVKCIDNAFLLTDGDKIVDFGKTVSLRCLQSTPLVLIQRNRYFHHLLHYSWLQACAHR